MNLVCKYIFFYTYIVIIYRLRKEEKNLSYFLETEKIKLG